MISNINGALTSRRIDDLTPNTEYDFNISAITDAGQGPPFRISHMTDMDGERRSIESRFETDLHMLLLREY